MRSRRRSEPVAISRHSLSGYYSARAGMMTGVVPEWIGRDRRRGVRQPHRGPVQQKQPRQQLLGRFGRVQLHLCQALNYSRHRQKQLENRTVRTGALDDDFAAMVLHDLVNRRKAQSNAFGFSIADEGLKEILAKWSREFPDHCRPANLDAPLRDAAGHLDSSRIGWNGLSGVEEEVEYDAFKLSRVKPTEALTFVRVRNHDGLKLGQYFHRLNGRRGFAPFFCAPEKYQVPCFHQSLH